MKVVIDTNVLVSAAFRDRLPERVVLWCVGNQRLIWLATDVIIEEYFGVLRRPKFGLSSVEIARWTNLLAGRVRLIEASAGLEFPRDRKDAKFLHCAIAGKARYLITGDRDFEEASKLLPGRVVTARQFAAQEAPDLLAG